jgi:hypothetical protein
VYLVDKLAGAGLGSRLICSTSSWDGQGNKNYLMTGAGLMIGRYSRAGLA